MRELELNTAFSTAELLGYASDIFEWYRPYTKEDSWLVKYAGAVISWIRESGWVVRDPDGVPASPSVRGAEDIKTVARIYAFFDGSRVILPKHAKRAAYPALRGKFFLNREAIAEGLTHDKIIATALSEVPVTERVT